MNEQVENIERPEEKCKRYEDAVQDEKLEPVRHVVVVPSPPQLPLDLLECRLGPVDVNHLDSPEVVPSERIVM